MQFTLAGVIREQADTRPEGPCLTFEDRRFSFADMHERSSRLANALIDADLGPSDRVAILAKNHSAFYELAFACSKSGAIMLALNWRLAAPEIATIWADAQPSVLIVSEELRDLVPSDAAGDIPVISLEEQYEDWLADAAVDDPERSTDPDDVVFLLYTSGTTGEPKGVQITNRNLSFTRRIAGEFWEFDKDSVHLVAMPMFHIGGLGTGMKALMHGGSTVLLPAPEPEVLVEEIERHRVTHAFFVPAVIQGLTDIAEKRSADLSCLQLLIYGASPISESVLTRAMDVLGCRFTHAYGATETSGTVISLPPGDHDPGGPRAHLLRSCGKPFPWVEVSLVDPKKDEEVATGDPGEIWVRSDQVTKGYWAKPEETAKTITDQGWLRTGDAAYRDEEGYFYVFDRYKDMLVSGGENVYPAEVENALYKLDGIGEVAVIGVPHERWGETVKAIVVQKNDAELTEQDIIDFARENLAKYKCPTSVDFVDALPRSASGKVLKKDLREPYWEGEERQVS